MSVGAWPGAEERGAVGRVPLRRLSAVALAALATLAASGCRAGRTRLGDEASDRGAIVKLERQLRSQRRGEAVGVAIGVTTDGIVGVPLTGGSSWSFDHPLTVRPDVAGTVVVGTGRDEIFCLRAATGALLWTRPIGGLELVGIGDDGEMTAVSLASATGHGSTLLVVGRDGEVVRQLESDSTLGKPAVVQGIAFIPSDERQLLALDLIGGRLMGSLPVEHGLSTALVERQTLYFGDQSLERFDEQIAQRAPADLPRVSLPATPLVSSPRFVLPPRDARALLTGTLDRTRTLGLPTASGAPLALLGERAVVMSSRAVIGYQGSTAEPRWWQLLDRSPVASAAYQGGVAVCDAEGVITLLAEDSGHVEATLSLGRPVQSCLVQGGDLERVPSGAPRPVQGDQLLAVLRAADPDLAIVQREALLALDRLAPDASIQVLEALALDARAPVAVRAMLPERFGRHPLGPDRLLALVRPLNDPTDPSTRTSPLGGLVPILVALDERRAAPLLLAHLENPFDEGPAVRAAAGGLASLAGPAERAGLEAFFRRHLGTHDAFRIDALGSVVHALRRLGSPRLRAHIAAAIADPATAPEVRSKLESLAPP